MSARPAALRAITALLEAREGEAEPLVFKPGPDALIDRALAAVPTGDRAAGVAEVKALLGLVVVLREDRGARAAADQLDRALSRSPEVVRSLIELELARLGRQKQNAKLIAREGVIAAPRIDAAVPVGTVKVSSFGSAARDLERHRAGRRS